MPTIELPEDLYALVEDCVRAGKYPNVAAVVRAAFQALQDRDQTDDEKQAELEAALDVGHQQQAAGDYVEGTAEEIIRGLRSHTAMSINRFFEDSLVKALPPDARRWSTTLTKAREQHHETCCRLDRQRDGLVFKPARLSLVMKDRQNITSLDAPWSTALHEWLLAENVRSETLENEAERFGFALKDKFTPIEIRFGDGFFSSVLVNYLRGQGFADLEPTGEVLRAIAEPQPVKHEHTEICTELIEEVLMETARSLTWLRYSKAEREELLTKSIAYYLDERFSITNGRLLGFC